MENLSEETKLELARFLHWAISLYHVYDFNIAVDVEAIYSKVADGDTTVITSGLFPYKFNGDSPWEVAVWTTELSVKDGVRYLKTTAQYGDYPPVVVYESNSQCSSWDTDMIYELRDSTEVETPNAFWAEYILKSFLGKEDILGLIEGFDELRDSVDLALERALSHIKVLNPKEVEERLSFEEDVVAFSTEIRDLARSLIFNQEN